MAYKKYTREHVLRMLRTRQGKRSVAALAEEMKVSRAYLHDVLTGSREPGPSILRFLGLEKQITTVTVYRKRVAA